ncbi:hypothetical protein [Hydrogenophaga crassostreae]|uniref:DUF1439 domain-containing protein n=2 Tax=Hydrogenophaga crassostreae TaxID=1763535 RepID=A0A1D8P3P6_9BURK|nr:hypothetical protein [Hydrogenophaga crassostreae]AOW15918.1 hypothetical protein LPB072_21930 [Hydrogenophaga crassostreae]
MTKLNASRRDWLIRYGVGAAASLMVLPAARADDGDPRDQGAGRSVTTEELGEMLLPHFPIKYPVPGFLDLIVRTPRLAMRPQTNRIDADMDVSAQGPALNRTQAGRLGVGFALRYEARDKTVRAHQLSFNSLDFPGIRPEAVELIRVYGPALAQAALQEVVLHQFKDKDLAVLDVLGMRPGKITVTEDGLRIGFEPRPL